MGWGHATVNHGSSEWARDDDGDGVRNVQVKHGGEDVDGAVELPVAALGREHLELPSSTLPGVEGWRVAKVVR